MRKKLKKKIFKNKRRKELKKKTQKTLKGLLSLIISHQKKKQKLDTCFI